MKPTPTPIPPRAMPRRLRRRPTRRMRLPTKPNLRPMRRKPKSTGCRQKSTTCSRSRCRNNFCGVVRRTGMLKPPPSSDTMPGDGFAPVHGVWRRFSADDRPGAYAHPTRKLPDFRVGERHAAVGPVDRLVNPGVAAADAVDTQPAAKRRVLARRAMLVQGPDDGVEFRPVDESHGKGATGNAYGGIIEAIERADTAVAIDPGHVESALRRRLAAGAMDVGSTAAADGNMVEA